MIYLSSHRLTNFFEHDLILDWLTLYGKQHGYLENTIQTENTWKQWICQRGIQWEQTETKKLYEYANQMGIPIQTIQTSVLKTPEEWNLAVEQTRKAVVQRIPLIVQAPLSAELYRQTTFHGIADLLVHSSVIQRIPGLSLFQNTEDVYFILDWKQNRITEKLQFGKYANWFRQCWIYVQCALKMGIPIHQTNFGIIPQSIQKPDKTIYSGGLLQPMGVLYHPFRQIEHETILQKASQTFQDLYTGGHEWDLLTHPLLAPNARHQSSHPFSQAKQLIIRLRNELTQIPYVSPKRRAMVLSHLEQEHVRGDNPNIYIQQMGFTNEESRISKRVKRGLQILQFQNTEETWQELVQRCFPTKPKWFPLDLAVDFEFLPIGWLSNSVQQKWNRSIGFLLICFGTMDKNGKYVQHVLSEPTPEGERKLWELFETTIGTQKWFAWGHAEQSVLKYAPHLIESPLNLLQQLETIPFLPYPLLDYQLKHWGTYLVQHDLIPDFLPSIAKRLDLPDIGTFWIPEWIPWLSGEQSERPDTKQLLEYHLRDISWLYAIYANL